MPRICDTIIVSRYVFTRKRGKEDDDFSRHRHFPPSPHNEILPALLLIRGFRKLLAPASPIPGKWEIAKREY